MLGFSLLIALSSSLIAPSKAWAACNTYCHGAYAPTWGGSLTSDCNSCHTSQGVGNNPGTGYTWKHRVHISSYSYACEVCHSIFAQGKNYRTFGQATHANGPVQDFGGSNGKAAAEVKFHAAEQLSWQTTTYGGSSTLWKYISISSNPHTGSEATPGYYYVGNSTAAGTDNGYYGWNNGRCEQVWCHSNAKRTGEGAQYVAVYSTDTVTCTSCHGGAANPTTTLSVAHATHTRVGEYGYKCYYCHEQTVVVESTYTIRFSSHHVNATRTVKFSTHNANALAYDSGNRKCNDTYCHSNGVTVWTPGSTPSSTVTWTSTGTVNCGSCHGGGSASGKPNYDTGSPKPNSHSAHQTVGCQKCHNATTNNGTTITNFTQHANSSYTVTAGAGASFGFTYNNYPASSTCQNISCHGNNSATWGGTLTCYNCHTGMNDVDDYNYQGGTGTVALISTDSVKGWFGTGHGRDAGTYYDSGRPGAGFVSTCTYCHTSTVVHGSTTNPFRLANIDDSAYDAFGARRNGNCLVCHSTVSPSGYNGKNATVTKSTFTAHWGTKHSTETAGDGTTDGGMFCWDCHDPHGDYNYDVLGGTVVGKMFQLAPVRLTKGTTYNADPYAAYGVPFSTSADDGANLAVYFTQLKDGTTGYGWFDYLDTTKEGADFTEGVCQVCHSQGVVNYFNQKSSAPVSPHPTSGGACTTCHPHKENFRPAGCSGCHGNPDANTYWPDGSAKPDRAGSHLKHVQAISSFNPVNCSTSTDAGQKAICAFCHSGVPVHNGAPADLGNFNNIAGAVDASSAAWYSYLSSACYKSDCHAEKETPNNWYSPPAPTCRNCHPGPGTSVGPQTSAHNMHTSTYSYSCTECHPNNSSYSHTDAKVDINWTLGSTQTITNAFYDKFKQGTSTTGFSPSWDIATSTFGPCYNVYCHRPSSWTEVNWNGNLPNNSSKCAYCHQAPPTTGAGSYAHTVHNNGQVGISTTNSINDYQYGCGICHYNTNPSSITVVKGWHVAGSADGVSYSASSRTAQISFYTSFTGSGLYDPSPPTKATDGRGFKYTQGTCSGTYCHGVSLSSGTRQADKEGVNISTPSWNVNLSSSPSGGEKNIACGTCHNLFTSDSGNHKIHISTTSTEGYGFDCGKCHLDVDANPDNYKADISSRTNHVNKKKDVKFDWGGSFGQ